MFIYSLAELKDPDSSQKLCVIYHFKWLNTSESQTPGYEHVQKGLKKKHKTKNTTYTHTKSQHIKLPIISSCAPGFVVVVVLFFNK